MTDTRRRPLWGWQGWVFLAGATLFAIVIASFLLAAIADKAIANETGTISHSPAPATKWTTNQEWPMFNGTGETRCQIRYGSNNNRSTHNTVLQVRDDGQTVASLPIERASGGAPADSVTIDNPGNVTLALVVDGDSSASVSAAWACDERPPPSTTTTTSVPTTTSTPGTSSTTVPPTTVTSTTTTSTTVPVSSSVPPTAPTTSIPTSTTPSTPTTTATTTVPDSTPIPIPTGVDTGLGGGSGLVWPGVLSAIGIVTLSGLAVWRLRHDS